VSWTEAKPMQRDTGFDQKRLNSSRQFRPVWMGHARIEMMLQMIEVLHADHGGQPSAKRPGLKERAFAVGIVDEPDGSERQDRMTQQHQHDITQQPRRMANGQNRSRDEAN